LLVAIAVMGIFAYGRLSQAEDPPYTFKMMVIRTFWPGATAKEGRTAMTDKIEKKLQETPHIDRVHELLPPRRIDRDVFAKDRSRRRPRSRIFYQVRKKVGDIRHTLPAGIQGPFSTTNSATFLATSMR
jgi:multidrug efflux pump